MNKFPDIGDSVYVTKDCGKDLNKDRTGTVTSRDGEYIYVQLSKSGVVVECYLCELEEIE